MYAWILVVRDVLKVGAATLKTGNGNEEKCKILKNSFGSNDIIINSGNRDILKRGIR